MAAAHEVFETDFFGVARIVNAVLPGMRARRQGRIINVGSAAAWVGEPGGFSSASKHALAGYSQVLRYEVWPLGLQVSLVEPGACKTGVLDAAASSDGAIADYDAVRSAARRTLRESLGKGDEPHRVAQLIAKIARDRSPRGHYGVGPEAHWLPYLRVLLPQRLFDSLLRRGFHLPRHQHEQPAQLLRPATAKGAVHHSRHPSCLPKRADDCLAGFGPALVGHGGGGVGVPAVAGPGAADQPAADDDGVDQHQPELHHDPAAFGVPAQLAVLVAPGVGALHRPAAAGPHRRAERHRQRHGPPAAGLAHSPWAALLFHCQDSTGEYS